jgi:hypothetical protein
MRSLITFFAFAVVGCASTGSQFTQLEPGGTNEGVVYVYRTQPASRSMDLSPGVSMNGADVGNLKLDGYLRVTVPPGSTEVKLLHRAYLWPNDAPVPSVRFDLKAGETRFVQFSIDSFRHTFDGRNSTSYVGLSLQEVNGSTAMQFLPKLRDAR